MISSWKTKRAERGAAEFHRYSIRRSVVLSLLISVATTAVLSKKHLANLWVYAGAMLLPAVIVFYFKNRIVLLGPVGYTAVLAVILGAALLFGT